jgi:hypothetical protein
VILFGVVHALGKAIIMPGQKIDTSGARRPRASQMPRCAKCFDPMTAPESSVLLPSGVVSYLWCCDFCAETVVTSAAPIFTVA